MTTLKKLIPALAVALLALATLSFAAPDPEANRQIKSLKARTTALETAIDGETISAGTIDDDSIDFADVTGADLTLTDCGAITSSGKLTLTPVSANVTNTQAVTVSAVINVLNGVGQADTYTNTITLANPSAAGQICIVSCKNGSSNLVAIASSGNFIGPAVELEAGQSAILFAPTATNWCGLAQ